MSLDMSPEEERGLSMRPRGTAAELAWVLIFLDGLLLGSTSMFWSMWGRFFDSGLYAAISGGMWPNAAALAPSVERVASVSVRLAGFLGLMGSVFVVIVSLTSFRRGERWAWYAMWMLPCFATLDLGLLAGYGVVTLTALVWDATVFGLALLGLSLAYRLFFPNGTMKVAAERLG